MTAESGKDFLIYLGDGAPTENFTVIGGMRSNSLSISNETVDITSKSSNGWRELMTGGGMTSVSLSGSGVFTNETSQKDMQAKTLARSIDNYRIVFGSGDAFEGAFQITSLDYSGDYNGERTFSISFQSSGAVAFTTA